MPRRHACVVEIELYDVGTVNQKLNDHSKS